MKTKVRKVRQHYRIFTNEEKRKIINAIDNRPKDLGFIASCDLNGIANPQYYSWKKKLGMTTKVEKSVPMTKTNGQTMTVKSTVPMNVKTVKKLHTVTLSVEVGSIMDLINFCTNISKTPKVKHIVSVE